MKIYFKKIICLFIRRKPINQFYLFSLILLAVFFYPIFVEADQDFGFLLKGKILLQVEGKGEAWYVYPGDLQRYYLGRPEDALTIMKKLGLGIADSDLKKIVTQEDSFKVSPVVKNNIYIWGNVRDDLGKLEIKNDLVNNPQTSLDEFVNLFGIKNVVYNNSATVNSDFLSEKYLIKLNKDSNLKNIIVQVPIFELDSDETFDKIKKLCLNAKIYNIEGFLLDDFTSGHVSNEKLVKLYQLIKKTNPEVNLYVVYYYDDLKKAMEESSGKNDDYEKAKEIVEEINKNSDGVSFWFWNLDEKELFCDLYGYLKKIFPKKKIFVGVYMHDYINQKSLEEDKFFRYLYDALSLLKNNKINGLMVISSYWYNQEDHLILSEKLFHYFK